MVKEVPVENLKEKISFGWYRNEIFGSNEFSFLNSSYLNAALISKVPEIDLLSSPNKAVLDLAFLTSVPPPKKNRSACFVIFPSSFTSILLKSLYPIFNVSVAI